MTRTVRTTLVRFFFFQAEDGIRDYKVTGVQTCALPIYALSIVDRPARERFQALGEAVPAALQIPRLVTSSEAAARAFYEAALAAGHEGSEERRVGKEGRSRWSPYHLKKKRIRVRRAGSV